MKRILFLVLILIGGMGCLGGWAQNAFAEPVELAGLPAITDVQPLNPWLDPDISVTGELHYILNKHAVGLGAGINAATLYDGLATLKLSMVLLDDGGTNQTLWGPGLNINLKKAVEKAGGTWNLGSWSASLGANFLFDFKQPMGWTYQGDDAFINTSLNFSFIKVLD